LKWLNFGKVVIILPVSLY